MAALIGINESCLLFCLIDSQNHMCT